MSESGRRATLPELVDVSEPTQSGEGTTPTRELSFAASLPESIAGGDFVSNRAAASTGFTIRNNVVRENRANLIRLAAQSGLVENNALKGSQNATINIITDTTGTFAPEQPSEDITIRGNTIQRSGMVYLGENSPSAVRVTHNSPEGVTTKGHPHRRLTVADNDIEMTASNAFMLNDAATLDVRENEITDVNMLDYPNGRAGIILENVREATFTDNRLAGASDYLSAFGRRYNCEEISQSENQFILDGETRPAEFSG